MIRSKKLVQMAKKWRQAGRMGNYFNSSTCKGRITVYTMDEKRFMVPVSYLSNDIFRQLFHMAEELFGVPTDKAITLPCDAEFMENVVSFLQKRHASKDVERDLLNISSSHCSSSPLSQASYQQFSIKCFVASDDDIFIFSLDTFTWSVYRGF